MHIRSYFDYDRELTLFLSCLPPAAGLRFGVSCLQRFRELFGSSVAKELEPTLSEPVRAAYQNILVIIIAMLISTALEGYSWSALSVGGAALALLGTALALRARTPA